MGLLVLNALSCCFLSGLYIYQRKRKAENLSLIVFLLVICVILLALDILNLFLG